MHDFVGASLRDLNFRDEDLRGFDFSSADLTGANFRGAKVTGVRFAGADLTGAIGYGKIVQWKDEKTLLKLGDFVELIGGPHFGQRGSIAELFESKIALIELESKQRVKVKHNDFVLFRDRPPRHSEN
jgi:transcription antitermination factor NusG